MISSIFLWFSSTLKTLDYVLGLDS